MSARKKWRVISRSQSFRCGGKKAGKMRRRVEHRIRQEGEMLPFPPPPRGIESQRPLFRGTGSIWEPPRCSWHLAGIQLNIDPAPFSAGKQLCTLINASALSAQSNRIVLEYAAPAHRGSSISRDVCSSPRSNRSILIKRGTLIATSRGTIVN